jgi:hypothetical protein
MPTARKSDETADPLDVRVLGPNAVVTKPHYSAGLVDETPRTQTILGHERTSPSTPAERSGA